MRLFLLIAALLSLSVGSCTPDDPVLPVPPSVGHPEDDDADEPTSPPSIGRTMTITAGGTSFTATLADNATVAAFRTMLPLTLPMSDFNANEKVASLARGLPTAASNPGTIHAGDVMLFGSNALVVFYETFSTSYSYTRIGWVDNPLALKTALGSGRITLKFE